MILVAVLLVVSLLLERSMEDSSQVMIQTKMDRLDLLVAVGRGDKHKPTNKFYIEMLLRRG